MQSTLEHEATRRDRFENCSKKPDVDQRNSLRLVWCTIFWEAPPRAFPGISLSKRVHHTTYGSDVDQKIPQPPAVKLTAKAAPVETEARGQNLR